jgi:polysaccharide biosynthesis/export protein
MKMNGRLSITHVAKSIGVTPRTIMRWEKAGKIKRSKRDWRGWRFYVHEDLDDIRKFYESTYEYGESAGSAISELTKGTLVAILAALLSLPIILGTVWAQEGSRVPGVTETKNVVNVNLAALPVVETAPATVAEASKYTLGPDDVIMIEVRRHPEFGGQYTVTAEGKIEYKFVGDIVVAGLTKLQLQERLAKILSEFILDPEVNVQIVSYLSKVFYVVGEVNRPGKFYMKGNTITVLEAIIQAGLPNMSSSTRKCRLIHPNTNGKENYAYVNVYEILYGGNMKENVEMKPGDILYVPATIIAKVVRIVQPVTNAASSAVGSAAAGAALAL